MFLYNVSLSRELQFTAVSPTNGRCLHLVPRAFPFFVRKGKDQGKSPGNEVERNVDAI